MKSCEREANLEGESGKGPAVTPHHGGELRSPVLGAASTGSKCLFVSPVGAGAEGNIRKIVARFGHEQFDFLLLVYDDSPYADACFSRCRIIHDRQPLFPQLKTHLTPELCRGYEYVFVWMDDLDVLEFDPQRFLRILREHRIELAQPSLSPDSAISHEIVVHRDGRIGRYTDFVEQMALVFEGKKWERCWELIRMDENPWGWGYDELLYACCRCRRMAIIDAEVVRHLRQGAYHAAACAARRRLLDELGRFYVSRKSTLCDVSDRPWRKRVMTPLRLIRHRLFVDLYATPPVYRLRRFIRARVRPLLAKRKFVDRSGR